LQEYCAAKAIDEACLDASSAPSDQVQNAKAGLHPQNLVNNSNLLRF